MKARDIYNATNALRVLSSEKLPIKAAYAVSRLSRKLEEEFKTLEQTRTDLVKRYGKTNDDGSVTIPQEDTESINKFLAEFNEILESDITFEFNYLDIEQFGTVEVTPGLLTVLDPFIKTQ